MRCSIETYFLCLRFVKIVVDTSKKLPTSSEIASPAAIQSNVSDSSQSVGFTGLAEPQGRIARYSLMARVMARVMALERDRHADQIDGNADPAQKCQDEGGSHHHADGKPCQHMRKQSHRIEAGENGTISRIWAIGRRYQTSSIVCSVANRFAGTSTAQMAMQ